MVNAYTSLDDSIDFIRDAATNHGLGIQTSHSFGASPLLTDRNLRSAMQDDALHLVERLKSTYIESEGDNTHA